MEDYYAHRNSGHRYLIQKIDDSKEIQLVDGNGLADEQHTQIMRVYPHGFSSHSIKDSHMLSLGLGGRRDMLVALGGEHAQKRPKHIPEGDTVLYNAEGDVIRLFGKNTLDITHAKNIKLSIGQGLATSQGGSSSATGGASGAGGAAGQSGGQGKDAKAGPDKDVTIVIKEASITLTKGKTVVTLDANQFQAKHGDATVTIKDSDITVHHAQKVIVDSPKVLLGSASASQPVMLCSGDCATKVFAE